MSWPLPEGMDDAELEKTLGSGSPAPTDRRSLPELAYLLEEMRKPHVTLTLLWMEYKAAHPDYPINTQTATAWFDHIVLSTEYIGPLAPR